jgi:Asparagine synthase (glutamine-hydrolyzing)
MTEILTLPSGIFGFQRLSIMDLSFSGMQPFTRNVDAAICNGEIYGFRKLKNELIKKDISLFLIVIVKYYFPCIMNMD